MSGFEFFFTFYGLVLGLAVAELLGGLSRVIHERVRPGLLTTLLALFVAIDAATFWNQAWTIFRQAPYNFALLIVGLMIAGAFFVAATLVFPREPRAGMNLDDHFWRHRRTVLLCLLAANLTVAAVFMGVAGLSGTCPPARLAPGSGSASACSPPARSSPRWRQVGGSSPRP